MGQVDTKTELLSQQHHYGRQSSTGNHSLVSQTSVNTAVDSLQDSPPTAMTIVSNVNPFPFPSVVSQQSTGHQQHGVIAEGSGDLRLDGSVSSCVSSQTLPTHNHMQPVPKTHSLPSQARWAGILPFQHLSRTASVPEEVLEDCDLMVENPLNAQFEQEKVGEPE